MTEPDGPPTSPEWAERERYWRRKLGRLRLGVEPLEVQLERHRRATWALAAVAGSIGLFFVALFTAFEAPGTGLIVAGVLVGPVIGLAWLDFLRMRRRASRYEQERRAHEASGATSP